MLRSAPKGASISIDGIQRCSPGLASCKVQLQEGTHEISMSLVDHFTRTERVEIMSERTQVNWNLKSNSGMLEITSKPRKLNFLINQKSHTAPVSMKVRPHQNYEISVENECFQSEAQSIIGQLDQVTRIHLEPKPKRVSVEVRAINEDGGDLKLPILVDSSNVGTTPTQVSIPICSKELLLQKPEMM